MYTRRDYLDGICTHSEYYAQFVNDHIINLVVSRIGSERLQTSEDKNLNDIPLEMWDDVGAKFRSLVSAKFRSLGDIISMAGLVCVAKEAARQHLTALKTGVQ